jgi:hypothetical protein
VGGVCALCAPGDADLESSPAPDVEGNTGIDMRWESLCAPDKGDSGLLALGVCEFRREDCVVGYSELAHEGVLPAAPFCDAGEATVGRACMDLANVVISARSIAVRSHMMVFMVVVFRRDVGGTNIVSGGRRGCGA